MLRLRGLSVVAETPGATSNGVAQRVLNHIQQLPPYVIVWWCLIACILAGNAPRLLGEVEGPLAYLFTVGATGGCAWAWLFSRTLFRPAKTFEYWPLLVVAGIIAVESFWAISDTLANGAGTSEISRIAGNATSLVCISALFLVFIEALTGYGRRMAQQERRFRVTFVVVYGALIAVCMVWASNAAEGSLAARWSDAVIFSAGVTVVIAGRLSISYRKRHPLPEAGRRAAVKAPPPAAAIDGALAQRILETIKDEDIFTTPNLKVADLSAILGEQEYKVSQCITGYLQFANFNRFVNRFRIEHARQALTDPAQKDRPILSIAFECGFNSIGPFNRAFKLEMGMTPREWRSSNGVVASTPQANRLGAGAV